MADSQPDPSSSHTGTEELSQSGAEQSSQSGSEECSGPPDGFRVLIAPDGQKYLVPNFLSDATCYAFYREDARSEILPDSAAGGVGQAVCVRGVFTNGRP